MIYTISLFHSHIMGKVFLTPLNWGLGHSTRDIPIIEELIRRGHEVTVGTSGNALTLLKRECPECNFILFKDYPAPYSASRFFLPKFAVSIPLLLQALARERKKLAQILSENDYDLIISDNRMGVYSERIPSYFITHQLRFSLPDYLYPFELLTLPVNGFFHTKFDGVIVPDIDPNGGRPNLSGKLCRTNLQATRKKAYFAGILTSTKKMKMDEDLDYLIMVSGPEPQRTKLEEIILKQVTKLPGEKVVLLGSPQKELHSKLDEQTIVHSYLSTEEKVELMNRARFLITRSGYTTMMEMVEVETEQEYLSRYYAKQGWFLSRSQYRLKLPEDAEKAMKYNGFPEMTKTRENVQKLYQDVLKMHLN